MPDTSDYTEFDPRAYLRTYYTRSELESDEVALFRTLVDWLRGLGRPFPTAIDVGCGPTLHHTFAVAPFVGRLDYADYLPANRDTVHDWFAGSPNSHDWQPLFADVLRVEGADGSRLADRTALYRARRGDILPCDLRRPDPLGASQVTASGGYDLVVSFFCGECVAANRDDWPAVVGRVLDLVRPGGAVFYATMRNCHRYRVLDRWFSSVPVTEHDFADLFRARGFDPASVVAEAVPAPAFAADGFDHIILSRGVKPA